MLDRQTAQKRLEDFHVEGWTKQRVARAGTLPGKLAPIARAILWHDDLGRPIQDWNVRIKTCERFASQFESLSRKNRHRIIKVIFSQLAPHVEKAWEISHRLPYQTGTDRKAFRAPNSPAIGQRKRFSWLQSLAQAVEGYDQDITWFAAWSPYLWWGAPHTLGSLFAGAIENGGEEGDAVFDILVASAEGEHEIGAMGRHVPSGLLISSRPEGWDFIERLLLAAQRQEGLRQVILETVDEAHPEAFRRMLHLILDHKLTRFSATVRAADTWFDLGWESNDALAVNQTLKRVLQFLEDPKTQEQALTSDDGQTLYLALWAMAFENAAEAWEPAARLLKDSDVERRFAATHLLSLLGINKSQEALLSALEDEDLRVVARALTGLHRHNDESLGQTDLFERIEQIIPRFPSRTKELDPIVWPWIKLSANRQMATNALIWSLGSRSPKRLIPHLPAMSADDRDTVVRQLAKMPRRDAEVRDTLFSLVGDRSRWVRKQALKALANHKATPEEATQLESLLTRKAADLRRGTLSILANQKDKDALASAKRLLETSNVQQRLAGLDLLRQMIEAERTTDQCQALASRYQTERSSITDAEKQALAHLIKEPQEVPTLDNALGLMNLAERTPAPKQPKTRQKLTSLFGQKSLVTPAAIACLKALDDLVHEHSTAPITVGMWDGSQREELLGNIKWGFPNPKPDITLEKDARRLPLKEVWETWLQERPKALRDSDGLELLRAVAALSSNPNLFYDATSWYKRTKGWLKEALSILFAADKIPQMQYPHIVSGIAWWLVHLHPPVGAVDLILDAVETTLALVPNIVFKRVPTEHEPDWRPGHVVLSWLTMARQYRLFHPAMWQDKDHVRLWGYLRWIDEPAPLVPRHRPNIEDLLFALQAGGATEADLLDHLLGPRSKGRHAYFGRHQFSDLWRLTGRKSPPSTKKYPTLHEVVDRCRKRILEVEINRGEMPTAASLPALALRYSGGTEIVVQLLRALGRGKLVRGWTYDNLSKAAVFSHLIRASGPAESDTPDAFAAQVEDAGIRTGRLIELAVYAPQWASFVEHALKWPGLADAIWWIHAHTKDIRWTVDREVRDMWNAQISEYTPLSGQQLLDGAVDVTWFFQTYNTLGAERWEQVYKAAKFASGGGGHKRAQLFADAMLGRVEKIDMVSRINEKRHKDVVRALGLLPLSEDPGTRQQDLLERYRVLQEFLRTSRKFGSQRQASEKLATTISLANLARTAGYPDPVRLEWAMEAKQTADLIGEGKSVTEGEVTVALAVNQLGDPELTITRGKKPLRSIPKALKKNARIADLRERRKELKRQSARMRRSLEQAMSRGDRFTGAEIAELFKHPLLTPMLKQLVFAGDSVIGYPVEDGTAIECHDGKHLALGNQDELSIAHPYDLFTTQEWHHWQRKCYTEERTQPFKQVFRELYLLTETEKDDKTVSRRYAGHQVNPRQSLALLGSRGWVNYPEEGIRRTFHDENISAWLTFIQGFFTPAEVEGLTVEGVWFSNRGEWKPLSLTEIPPRLFSEVMRDIDLVVSVAHQGGVDPEASASTIEMRSSLVQETCRMLGLENVQVEGRYALIEGALASYNIHLGSAVVHQQPGGSVCIVPVHAQHRGRLFLPFVDDDPKTAEVISKVLLLARDTEIKDPTILEQIIGGQ